MLDKVRLVGRDVYNNWRYIMYYILIYSDKSTL